jgi:YD repeat-containing protein
MTDFNGKSTFFGYDTMGRPTKQLSPDGSTKILSYNFLGTPGPQNLQIQLPNGLEKRVFIDGFGRAWYTEQMGADGKSTVVEMRFNSRDQITALSTPYLKGVQAPLWNYLSYEAMGRLQSVKKAGSAEVSYCYDGLNTFTVNENEHLSASSADAYGRVKQQLQFKGNVKRDCDLILQSIENLSLLPYSLNKFSYNVYDQLETAEDSRGNLSKYQHDTLGRLAEVVDPDWGKWRFEYDLAGNLTGSSDSSQDETHCAYDKLNRVTQKASVKPGHAQRILDEFRYDETQDGTGKLTSSTDSLGIAATDYDEMGRIVTESRVIRGHKYKMSFEYDQNSRLKAETFPMGDKILLSYNGPYESSINRSNHILIDKSNFDALGNAHEVHFQNGTVASNRYGGTSANGCVGEIPKLCGIKIVGGNGIPLADISYSYDPKGNVIQIQNQEKESKFQFDALDRLSYAEYTAGPNGPQKHYNFQYDSLDNITWNSAIGSYSYDSVVQPHAVK